MNYEGIACERIRMGAHNFCQSAVYSKVIVSMFSRLSYVYLTYILRISYVYPTCSTVYNQLCVYWESGCKSTAFFRNKQEKCKKSPKNLFYSKKSCTFARFFGWSVLCCVGDKDVKPRKSIVILLIINNKIH